MPKISVIIPTWNRRKFLQKAIQSALSQINVTVEILVCDDGSDDGTCEMVTQWNDKRIHLITGPHTGQPAIPRNRGIATARGEWLAFLDDDDEWYKDKLYRQIKAAQNKNCKAVCSDAFRRLSDGTLRGRYIGEGILPQLVTFKDLLKTNWIVCSSSLIHSSILSKIEKFPEDPRFRASEDYAFWLRVATLTNFAVVDAPLLEYTDEPQKSIRKFSVNSDYILNNILSNYIFWNFPRHIKFRMLINAILRKIQLNKNLKQKKHA